MTTTAASGILPAMATATPSAFLPAATPVARPACPADGDDLPAAAPGRADLLRRVRLPLAVVAVLVLAAVLTGAPAHAAMHVVHRLAAADPGWVAAAVGFEVASFAGYVVLSWHVASRTAPLFDLATAYRTTVAGAAATRLLPTAGAGGAALTLWVLRRCGAREAGRTLMTFLVVLYAVFLLAVATAGTAVALAGRPAVGAPPAALAVVAMATAVLLGRRAGRPRSPRPTPPAPTGPTPTWSAGTGGPGAVLGARSQVLSRRASAAGRTLGLGVRDAAEVVRERDPRLLGAVAWWGFDVAVLGAAVHAVGGSLALGTLVLAYFLGQVANTLPVPGAASSGLAGVLIVLGADPAAAVAAVLTYRAVAVWLPAPAGALALAGLRRSVIRWGVEERARASRCRQATAGAHAPQPLAA